MMRRAFTLTELLVVVMILALLATFTVPTYQLILSQLQLSQAAEQAADHVRSAQQRTVTEQVVYGVTLTTNATTIPLFKITNPVTLTKATQETYSLPQNIKISATSLSNQTDIRFSTAGAPSTSGTFTIQDTVRNRTRLVEIRPSGNIRVGNEQ